MLTLSLIIPVYNEERHIHACLNAIAGQTVPPLEVIVVDNNCTDRTLEIAESFGFVTIVKESSQGRAHARNAGFNSARGDIIGRIDADSRIHKDWVEKVLDSFKQDPELAGLTGMAYVPYIPYVSKLKSQLFARTYYWFAHASFDTITMWGATMALRKSNWQNVSSKASLDDENIHEDQDVSLWVAADGGKIIQNNAVLINTDAQSYRYLPKFRKYYKMYKNTKKLHKHNGNLANPNTKHLGFFHTLPGRMLAILPTIYISTVSIVLFPIDYILYNSSNKPDTLT